MRTLEKRHGTWGSVRRASRRRRAISPARRDHAFGAAGRRGFARPPHKKDARRLQPR
jgi:hypothetical protein